MAKKFAKTVVGLGALAVAGKVAYDKYKNVKEKFTREERDSESSQVKKYNAVMENKIVEIEDEEFAGCEVKVIGSKVVVDLGLAIFEKDVYINFSSTASHVTIILPEGVNATCDIEKTVSNVKNLVNNVDEEDVHTVYIIGKATASNVEVMPVNFYMDDDDDFEDMDETESEKDTHDESESSSASSNSQTQTDDSDSIKTEESEESEKPKEDDTADADELDIKEVSE